MRRAATVVSRRQMCQLRRLATSAVPRALPPGGQRIQASHQILRAWSHRCLPKVPTTSTTTRLSSSTATTPAAAPASTESKPVRDFFLDNMGKIFLSAIGLIIVSLVRSSYGTSNMKAVKEQVEDASALDPLEIDELRKANTELTPHVFRQIVQDIVQQQRQSSGGNMVMSYQDFVQSVRTTLTRVKGEGCTIGMGYLLDRVVIATLNDNVMTEDTDLNYNEARMPVSFWLTLLSLALQSPVPDRIQLLYEVLQLERSSNNSDTSQGQLFEDESSSSSSEKPEVMMKDVTAMVGYLQDTCQLVPETQVIATEVKYPTQQYKRGTPRELIQWKDESDESSKTKKESLSQGDPVDVDGFAAILRSRAICAWGECYHKKKYVP